MSNQKSEIIQVRVSPEIQEALQAMADADNRSLSGFIRFHLTKLVQGSVKKSPEPASKPIAAAPTKEKRSKTPREEEAEEVILETSKRKFVLNP